MVGKFLYPLAPLDAPLPAHLECERRPSGGSGDLWSVLRAAGLTLTRTPYPTLPVHFANHTMIDAHRHSPTSHDLKKRWVYQRREWAYMSLR